MNTRGQYGTASLRRGASYYGAQVGLTLYHSVGDRADAVKQMVVDWSALYQNLASQVGEITPDPKAASGYHITTQREWEANPPDPKKVAWWKSYASPLIKQWVAFKRKQLGDSSLASSFIAFAERFQTNWDVYEDWKKKLDALRTEAQQRGFTITTSVPTKLPPTVWADVARTVEQGAGAVATGVGDVWHFVKYGAWAILGVGAVVALSSVAQSLRSGRDPAETYMELIRQGRIGPRVRALLSPPQRALPPGSLV